MDLIEFKELIWEKGRELYRPMPWREDTRPYYVLVSEIMLQQTQVDRVIPKFLDFIQAFPTVEALAVADLSEVLKLWSGLGYNRRAKYLHEAARAIVQTFGGSFPETREALQSLPGVGPNTAGAILAYSFNQPAIFIETNVRTVYFYHLFTDQVAVHDKELRIVVEQTIDHEHPREWYWALMDYGTFLKRMGAGMNTKSHHYKKQAPLKGSVREVRGLILKALSSGSLKKGTLKQLMPADERFEVALDGLVKDGLVTQENGQVSLSA